MFRIGDFARISQVSVKALRFYDEIGLLKPTHVDRVTGYRYYAAGLLSRLSRILLFKELGFSLEEIALLLREDLSASQARAALQSKRAELAYRIAHEQSRLAQLETLLQQIDRDGRAPDYEVRLVHVPPQLVASARGSMTCYEDAADLFAELTRHLKKSRATGQSAAIWHTCADRAERIDCEAVVFLDEPAPESKRVKVYRLPAITSACVIHQGSDETITQAYLAARSWIEARGYAVGGPLRELYWQGGIAQDDGFGVTEVQYPILKARAVTSAGN